MEMSYGQKLMNMWLDKLIKNEYYYIDNYRPEWLQGLELDRLYPELHLAFEFQGDQHYVSVEKFNSDIDYQKRNDAIKKDLCRKNGIYLMYLDAINLNWASLKNKLKYCNHYITSKFHIIDRNNTIINYRVDLRKESSLSKEYIKTLRDLGCVTAYKKSSKKRKYLMEFHT